MNDARSPLPSGPSGRVLLAIPEAHRRDGIAGIIHRSGYDVVKAGTAEEVRRSLETGEIHMIVICEHFGPPSTPEVLDMAVESLSAVVLADGDTTRDERLSNHPRVVAVLPSQYTLGELRGALARAFVPPIAEP